MKATSFFSPVRRADYFDYVIDRGIRVPFNLSRFLPEGRRAFVMVIPVTGVRSEWMETSDNGRWCFGHTSGWNGSYHDAWYEPTVFVWACGSGKFKRARKKLHEAVARHSDAERIDSSVARYRARLLVREGD